MRIILIATKDYNFFNFRREFILQMIAKGYEVCLVCPYGNKIDYFIERGCSFIDIRVHRRGTNILQETWLLLQCIKIFLNIKPDLVLTYTTKCSIYPGIACRLLGIRYIVNNAGLINANRILSFILRCLYRVAYKGASCMMYQNAAERDYINKILKYKVHYKDIPGSGVDLKEFQYEEYPSDNLEIIFNYVGRIVEIKGINEFLKCAEVIKSRYKNTRFIIYGEFDDFIFQKKIEKLVEDDIVEYAGVILDMVPAIKQAHAVIHASHYEGMTNVVLEHSAMGRVCFGSNIPGVKEGIDNGITGFLFEVRNVSDLVEKVITFIEMPYEQKVEMGKNARKKMEKEFDRRIITSIYLQEIDNVVGAK